MAGAGSRTRKDGTPSAKVGSIERLRPKMLGPGMPGMAEVRRLGAAADAGPKRGKLADELAARAASARAARTAFMAARRGEAERRHAAGGGAAKPAPKPAAPNPYHEGGLTGPLHEQLGPHDHEGAGRSRYWDTPTAQRAAMMKTMMEQAGKPFSPKPDRDFAKGWLNEHQRVQMNIRHNGGKFNETAAKMVEENKRAAGKPSKSRTMFEAIVKKHEANKIAAAEREKAEAALQGGAKVNETIGKTIRLSTRDGKGQEVPVLAKQGDFALHRPAASSGISPVGYTITHAPTGLNVGPLAHGIGNEAQGKAHLAALNHPEFKQAFDAWAAAPKTHNWSEARKVMETWQRVKPVAEVKAPAAKPVAAKPPPAPRPVPAPKPPKPAPEPKATKPNFQQELRATLDAHGLRSSPTVARAEARVHVRAALGHLRDARIARRNRENVEAEATHLAKGNYADQSRAKHLRENVARHYRIDENIAMGKAREARAAAKDARADAAKGERVLSADMKAHAARDWNRVMSKFSKPESARPPSPKSLPAKYAAPKPPPPPKPYVAPAQNPRTAAVKLAKGGTVDSLRRIGEAPTGGLAPTGKVKVPSIAHAAGIHVVQDETKRGHYDLLDEKSGMAIRRGMSKDSAINMLKGMASGRTSGRAIQAAMGQGGTGRALRALYRLERIIEGRAAQAAAARKAQRNAA